MFWYCVTWNETSRTLRWTWDSRGQQWKSNWLYCRVYFVRNILGSVCVHESVPALLSVNISRTDVSDHHCVAVTIQRVLQQSRNSSKNFYQFFMHSSFIQGHVASFYYRRHFKMLSHVMFNNGNILCFQFCRQLVETLSCPFSFVLKTLERKANTRIYSNYVVGNQPQGCHNPSTVIRNVSAANKNGNKKQTKLF